MASADSFAVEQGKGEKAIAWMNEYAKKNRIKFEARLKGYSIQSVKFGAFEIIEWKGDWPPARNMMKKASSKLGIKTIESGYHEKKDLITTMFAGSSEYGKVYSNGNLVGQVEMVSKSGKWIVKSEVFS